MTGRSESGSSALISEFEAVYLLVDPSLNAYVRYAAAEKKKLAELLFVKGVAAQMYPEFVGHEYLQHGECGW